ncbi:MAG: ABC transporter substrate-binding protein [Thaumarchaeota archaeon]|nr:ABC transporter substrate-binding protein [Nitrososphaerota archaeon]
MLFNEVLGAQVPVPEAPARIVSFSPAATETLFQIGLGEKIVGVSAFCARPAEAKAKRRLGSYNTVRDEILDELHPDLILTVTGYQREFAVRLSKKYPVYPLELPVSVAGIVDFIVKVGLVSGEPDRGRELGAALLRSLGKLRKVTDLEAYVEVDLGGPVTFGSYSYITDALKLLGCSHLYEDSRSEWLEPDFGKVADADPDLVVYEPKMYSKFKEGDVLPLFRSRGWGGLRAVKLENVFVTPGPLDFLAHHGPSFITEALPWLEGKLRLAKERIES